jgi:hypothetical protein
MIDAFGGTELFYRKFFIGAVCPLGFTNTGETGKSVNYNYYDSPALIKSVKSFIIENIRKQLDTGISTDTCFCLGTGKNHKFLEQLNNDFHFFGKIVPLEHPRFIMQYKTKQKQIYIKKYLDEFMKL